MKQCFIIMDILFLTMRVLTFSLTNKRCMVCDIAWPTSGRLNYVENNMDLSHHVFYRKDLSGIKNSYIYTQNNSSCIEAASQRQIGQEPI